MPTNLWYNQGVPQLPKKKSEQIAVKVDPDVFKQLSEIAQREERPLGQLVRMLMLRGLSLYQQDGKLRGDAPNHTEALQQLAPVVAYIEGGGQVTKQDVQRMIDAADISEIEKRLKPRKNTIKVPVRGKVS
jgi:hypothetical protein